jgi:hypothetical protein
LKEVQIVQLKLAEGFTNNKLFWFARLVFNSADGMKKYKYYLEQNDITIPGIPELYKPIKFKCVYCNKFKKWIPITLFSENGVI